ncbi:MAG: aryl-sulfate sulfotransferase [Bacteroidia bacterium]
MRIYFIVSVLIFSFLLKLKAQEIIPENGNTLNYTQVLFEFPKVEGATNYVVDFFECNNVLECKKLYTHQSKIRSFIISDKFDFGKNYKWNYKAYNGKKLISKSQDYYFTIATNEILDTNLYKIKFTKPIKNRKKGIIILDAMKVGINMKGKPVYFLNYNYSYAVRDINLTNQNSITVVDNRLGEIKEHDLNGKIIWIGPSNRNEDDEKLDRFHHELDKLKSGNYIAAGKRSILSFEPQEMDISNIPSDVKSETIVEFDKDNNEVWRFNLLPELKKQFNISPGNTVFNPSRLGHLNGIAVDEKKNIVYASFKTFSTVMKIDKSNNTVLYKYGNKNISFKDSMVYNAPFEQQHAPAFLPDGNLVIFNNGNDSTGSGIVVLNTADDVKPENEVIARYLFKNFLKQDYYGSQMGSVQYLNNNSFLVCMGSSNHVFECKPKSKKLLWQLYTYQNRNYKISAEPNWKPITNYRAYYYSSLFQYHFIVDMVSENDKFIEIIVNNIGSEDDVYSIKLNEDQIIDVIKIKSEKSSKVKIDKSIIKANLISVKSVNSGFVKELQFK